jgi:hypothetical protein
MGCKRGCGSGHGVQVDDRAPDCFERFFACIFNGITTVEVEPPWYADCRLLLIPGIKQQSDAQNADLAYEYLQTQIRGRPKELERLGRCVCPPARLLRVLPTTISPRRNGAPSTRTHTPRGVLRRLAYRPACLRLPVQGVEDGLAHAGVHRGGDGVRAQPV